MYGGKLTLFNNVRFPINQGQEMNFDYTSPFKMEGVYFWTKKHSNGKDLLAV